MTSDAPELDAEFTEYDELYDETELEEDGELDTAEEIDLLVRRVHAARQVGA